MRIIPVNAVGASAWLKAAGHLVLVACLSLAAACRTLPAPGTAAPPTPPVAPAAAVPLHYRIDAAASQVLILVYRDGPMARLGHNHVIAVRELSGDVAVPGGAQGAGDLSHASFALEFPVAAMAVDEPGLRAQQGEDFATAIDAASIAGTRTHMLGEALLDAQHYPTIRLDSEQLRADGDHWSASVRIRVRDHEAVAELPAAIEVTPAQLIASGEFDLTHTELGLTPYSVALGALRVAQSIHIRYRLVAQRYELPSLARSEYSSVPSGASSMVQSD